MTGFFAIGLLLLATGVSAQSVIAVRTVPSQSLVAASDVVIDPDARPGAMGDIASVIGQEARVTLYAGRPVMHGDIGPPTLVDRNQIVSVVFANRALRIETEGRVLDRGSAGSRVRVMNLSSRTIVVGEVTPDGRIKVGR